MKPWNDVQIPPPEFSLSRTFNDHKTNTQRQRRRREENFSFSHLIALSQNAPFPPWNSTPEKKKRFSQRSHTLPSTVEAWTRWWYRKVSILLYRKRQQQHHHREERGEKLFWILNHSRLKTIDDDAKGGRAEFEQGSHWWWSTRGERRRTNMWCDDIWTYHFGNWTLLYTLVVCE